MSVELYDFKAECGCYEVGDCCYDRDGDLTHMANEECTL